MDSLTGLLAFLVTLSLATERVTEIIKGLPLLSKWFTKDFPVDSLWEQWRKASVQLVAVVVGALFAAQVPEAVASVLKIEAEGMHWSYFLLFGALASGGSGLWNSALDITREVKKQKEALTKAREAASLSR